MQIIFVLLLLFLGIGFFARQYTTPIRLVMFALIVGMLLYLYFT